MVKVEMDQEMKDFPSHAHNADKLYCCSYCVKAFVKKTNLQIHLRTRNTEKPFQCSQCNKKWHLASHQQTHTGEKPFQCSQCNKAFLHKWHLTSHLRTHTGEKPYQCTQCDKAFSHVI